MPIHYGSSTRLGYMRLSLPELDPSANVQIIHLRDERAPSTIRTRRGAVPDSVRGDGGPFCTVISAFKGPDKYEET